MLNLVVFETEEELCELTGLTEEELWQKGFRKTIRPYLKPPDSK